MYYIEEKCVYQTITKKGGVMVELETPEANPMYQQVRVSAAARGLLPVKFSGGWNSITDTGSSTKGSGGGGVGRLHRLAGR